MLRSALVVVVVIVAGLLLFSPGLADAKASLNFFHAVAGGPAVDVQVRSKFNSTAHTLYSDLEYAEVTDYTLLAGGLYDVIVVAHDDRSKVITAARNKLLLSGVDYTMLISGLLTDQEKYPLRIITFVDDNTEPDDGEAKLRFIHSAAGFNPLDVVLDDRKIFSTVRFGEHGELIGTGYADVDSDKYTLLVMEQGLTFDSSTLELDDGDVLTVFAVGMRDSSKYGPKLVSHRSRESDDSAAASLAPWLRLFF